MFIPESLLFYKKPLENSVICGDYESACLCVKYINYLYQEFDLNTFIYDLCLKWSSSLPEVAEPYSMINLLFSEKYLQVEAFDLATLTELGVVCKIVEGFKNWLSTHGDAMGGFITYRKYLLINACVYLKDIYYGAKLSGSKFKFEGDPVLYDITNNLPEFKDRLARSLPIYGINCVEALDALGLIQTREYRPVANPALHERTSVALLRGNLCITTTKTIIIKLLREWLVLKRETLTNG